jgi:hypothetical protein
MKKIDRNVEASMPPATAGADRIARRRASAGGERQRHDAEDECERRHQDRPEADARRLDRRIHDRQSALAQLLGELDDQDRVLRRETDEEHQPTWQNTSLLNPRKSCAESAPNTASGTPSRMINGRMNDSYWAESTR